MPVLASSHAFSKVLKYRSITKIPQLRLTARLTGGLSRGTMRTPEERRAVPHVDRCTSSRQPAYYYVIRQGGVHAHTLSTCYKHYSRQERRHNFQCVYVCVYMLAQPKLRRDGRSRPGADKATCQGLHKRYSGTGEAGGVNAGSGRKTNRYRTRRELNQNHIHQERG